MTDQFCIESFLETDAYDIDAMVANIDFLRLGTALAIKAGFVLEDSVWTGQDTLKDAELDDGGRLTFNPNGLNGCTSLFTLLPSNTGIFNKEAYLPMSEKFLSKSFPRSRIATNTSLGSMQVVHIPVLDSYNLKKVQRAYSTAQELVKNVLGFYGNQQLSTH